ncbi:helix-turn-helix domain-containing protein [Muricoccus radiodurans]|uniref:helix-turn-helix domain-containing protein n=1 Tax=Muricoccus radiodurans TaxID=2231721 RepID=UPI003CF46D05
MLYNESGAANLTPYECREARRLLGWTDHRLAAEAHLTHQTVQKFEAGHHSAMASTVSAMWRALRDAGVTFVAGERPRLHRTQPVHEHQSIFEW